MLFVNLCTRKESSHLEDVDLHRVVVVHKFVPPGDSRPHCLTVGGRFRTSIVVPSPSLPTVFSVDGVGPEAPFYENKKLPPPRHVRPPVFPPGFTCFHFSSPSF